MVHLNKTLCTPLLSSVTMIVLKEGILTKEANIGLNINSTDLK